jgi:hypothetical protein
MTSFRFAYRKQAATRGLDSGEKRKIVAVDAKL